MKNFGWTGVTILVTATLVAACDRSPASDVAATVNGEAISRTDLDLEAAALGAGAPNSRQELLTQIVNRKLLAQEAILQKLDATPEFKTAERKARETALAEALMQKLVGSKANPTPAEVQSFIAANPAMFRSREVLSLDQLQVDAAAVDNDWLRPANSLADAARILKEHNVPFQRGRATADTASLAPELLKVLTDRPNEPFAVPQGDKLVVSQLVDRKPVAIPQGQENTLAAAEIRRRAYQQAGDSILRGLKAKGKVTLADGVVPASPSK